MTNVQHNVRQIKCKYFMGPSFTRVPMLQLCVAQAQPHLKKLLKRKTSPADKPHCSSNLIHYTFRLARNFNFDFQK